MGEQPIDAEQVMKAEDEEYSGSGKLWLCRRRETREAMIIDNPSSVRIGRKTGFKCVRLHNLEKLLLGAVHEPRRKKKRKRRKRRRKGRRKKRKRGGKR